MFGISFELYYHRATFVFSHFSTEKYQLQFLESEFKFKSGINRPIKIVEKNKYVRGRRKQNELLARINFNLDQSSKTTLIVFEDIPIKEGEYNKLKDVLGISKVIDPRKITVSKILKHVHRGRIESVYSIGNNQAELIHAQALKSSKLLNKQIKDCNLPVGMRICLLYTSPSPRDQRGSRIPC